MGKRGFKKRPGGSSLGKKARNTFYAIMIGGLALTTLGSCNSRSNQSFNEKQLKSDKYTTVSISPEEFNNVYTMDPRANSSRQNYEENGILIESSNCAIQGESRRDRTTGSIIRVTNGDKRYQVISNGTEIFIRGLEKNSSFKVSNEEATNLFEKITGDENENNNEIEISIEGVDADKSPSGRFNTTYSRIEGMADGEKTRKGDFTLIIKKHGDCSEGKFIEYKLIKDENENGIGIFVAGTVVKSGEKIYFVDTGHSRDNRGEAEITDLKAFFADQ